MEDKSFLYFTQDEVISKIDIDPRLIDSFKRVMQKLQQYFDANNYTIQRNYKEFLEKYLLNSAEKNMRFYINKIDRKGVGGFYSRGKNEICINENKLKDKTDYLDATFCHEFIHFLVMHSLTKDKSDSEILYGGFINEALTEMLTQQMYPQNNAYDAQVAMHKFANLVSGNVNNYSRFLNGYIDAAYASRSWDNYKRYTKLFQDTFDNKGYINLMEAQNNNDFIQAQRELIYLYLNPYRERTYEEYCDCISKLIDRPVRDQEYINKVVSIMDKTIINKILGFKANPSIVSFLEKKLSEVRSLIKESKKYNGKQVYEFEFAGQQIYIDKDLRGTILPGMQRGWSPQARLITYKMGNDILQLNYDEIDFATRDIKIQEKLDELHNYFSENFNETYSMLNTANEQTGELNKIEKFILPIVGHEKRKTPYTIYVASYADKIVILNNCEQIGRVSNIKLNEFIGMTSQKLEESAIYSQNLGTIEQGIIFTTLNEKIIHKRVINNYADELLNSITQEELINAIKEYKDSNLYSEEDTEEEVKKEALKFIAEKRYEMLSSEAKQRLINNVKNNSDKFVLSIKDGKVSVSAIHGSQTITAYKGEVQVLYDSKGNGLYNQIYTEIEKNSDEIKKEVKNQIKINESGNMFNDKKLISEIEKMLSITITDKKYTFDSVNKSYMVIKKDTNQLSIEESQLKQKINELYSEGTIDLKTKQQMLLAIINQYNFMRTNASKPKVVSGNNRQASNAGSDDYTEAEKYEEDLPYSASKNNVKQEKKLYQSKFHPIIKKSIKSEIEEEHNIKSPWIKKDVKNRIIVEHEKQENEQKIHNNTNEKNKKERLINNHTMFNNPNLGENIEEFEDEQGMSM